MTARSVITAAKSKHLNTPSLKIEPPFSSYLNMERFGDLMTLLRWRECDEVCWSVNLT
jgi:hypothetical protein